MLSKECLDECILILLMVVAGHRFPAKSGTESGIQGYLWFQVKFGEAVEECLITYV